MVKRTILLVCGWICVVLGMIGAFLPLLPTTPFLLLASACFMRGSPRLNHWLLSHPQFGPVLENWHRHRSVSPRVKRRANIMMVLSFAFSIYWVPLIWHKVMLLVMLAILLFWFNRLPVRENPPLSEPL
ncbi:MULTISPECIES: YbaN family protein [Photobacterium]|uniref:YbaN family protein n=1 Tax=Photobacterium TaxID=657 RepID=UPI001C2CFB98|nr:MULTISPECIES: YbaN family protein [Photobacterium]MBV1843582.1 YbaN family protein [Photobacterium ganghwense]